MNQRERERLRAFHKQKETKAFCGEMRMNEALRRKNPTKVIKRNNSAETEGRGKTVNKWLRRCCFLSFIVMMWTWEFALDGCDWVWRRNRNRPFSLAVWRHEINILSLLTGATNELWVSVWPPSPVPVWTWEMSCLPYVLVVK